MPNNLTDLTEAELAEALAANPTLVQKIRAADPRVQLMERLYDDPEAKREIQKHSKRIFPKASIAEVDIPVLVKQELKDDLDAIKALRTELQTEVRSRRHEAFRARLMEAGADKDDLDAIETFMVENEIGPKSLTVAVEKFYETKELAEPNTAAGLSPDLPVTADDKHMQALLAAPANADLDAINEPYAMQVFEEMFGREEPRGRRARTSRR